MRRNNVVFLVGEVIAYTRREMDIENVATSVLDLLLLTDTLELSGRHKVMVLGQQAIELSYLLAAASKPIEVMVLGWLSNGHTDTVVITDRVTAIVDPRTRQVAVSALRKHSQTVNSSLPEEI